MACDGAQRTGRTIISTPINPSVSCHPKSPHVYISTFRPKTMSTENLNHLMGSTAFVLSLEHCHTILSSCLSGYVCRLAVMVSHGTSVNHWARRFSQTEADSPRRTSNHVAGTGVFARVIPLGVRILTGIISAGRAEGLSKSVGHDDLLI